MLTQAGMSLKPREKDMHHINVCCSYNKYNVQHHYMYTKLNVCMSTGDKNAGVAYAMSLFAHRNLTMPDDLNFFGMQFIKESNVTLHLVRLAERYGFKAHVVTVDESTHDARFQTNTEPEIMNAKILYALLYYMT